MSRSVGKKRGAQPRTSSGASGNKRWPVFVAGIVTGLALAGGVYLLQILPTAMELRERDLASRAGNPAADSAKKPATTDDAADKKPVTFDFYNMLPSQKVVAPAPGRDAAAPAPVPVAIAPTVTGTTTANTITPAVLPPANQPPARPAPPPAAEVHTTTVPAATPPATERPAETKAQRFSLQAGSFATRAEADRRRGELVLSGHDASVMQASTDKGDTRFRVMIGPFADEAAMQKARQQLAGMKIDSLPVRTK